MLPRSDYNDAAGAGHSIPAVGGTPSLLPWAESGMSPLAGIPPGKSVPMEGGRETLYASHREAALSALEWGKITARLSAHASSEPGRDLCAALSPGTDLDAIRAALEENRDGRRMLLQDGALPLDEVKEIRDEVGKAAKGASLSPAELL